MAEAIHQLNIELTKLDGKVESHTDKFEVVTKNIDEIKLDIKSDSTQVWAAIFECQKNINKILWKIFGIVTIPVLFSILLQFIKK